MVGQAVSELGQDGFFVVRFFRLSLPLRQLNEIHQIRMKHLLSSSESASARY